MVRRASVSCSCVMKVLWRQWLENAVNLLSIPESVGGRDFVIMVLGIFSDDVLDL